MAGDHLYFAAAPGDDARSFLEDALAVARQINERVVIEVCQEHEMEVVIHPGDGGCSLDDKIMALKAAGYIK